MTLRQARRDRGSFGAIRTYSDGYDPAADREATFKDGWEYFDTQAAGRFDLLDFTRVRHPRPADLQRSNVEVVARFTELRDEWLLATQFLSSTHQMTMHPAYQQMIGLGPQVVPFMIDELRSGPQHYFWALAAIVGEDHGAGADSMREAARRWVEWYDRGR